MTVDVPKGYGLENNTVTETINTDLINAAKAKAAPNTGKLTLSEVYAAGTAAGQSYVNFTDSTQPWVNDVVLDVSGVTTSGVNPYPNLPASGSLTHISTDIDLADNVPGTTTIADAQFPSQFKFSTPINWYYVPNDTTSQKLVAADNYVNTYSTWPMGDPTDPTNTHAKVTNRNSQNAAAASQFGFVNNKIVGQIYLPTTATEGKDLYVNAINFAVPAANVQGLGFEPNQTISVTSNGQKQAVITDANNTEGYEVTIQNSNRQIITTRDKVRDVSAVTNSFTIDVQVPNEKIKNIKGFYFSNGLLNQYIDDSDIIKLEDFTYVDENTPNYTANPSYNNGGGAYVSLNSTEMMKSKYAIVITPIEWNDQTEEYDTLRWVVTCIKSDYNNDRYANIGIPRDSLYYITDLDYTSTFSLNLLGDIVSTDSQTGNVERKWFMSIFPREIGNSDPNMPRTEIIGEKQPYGVYRICSNILNSTYFDFPDYWVEPEDPETNIESGDDMRGVTLTSKKSKRVRPSSSSHN